MDFSCTHCFTTGVTQLKLSEHFGWLLNPSTPQPSYAVVVAAFFPKKVENKLLHPKMRLSFFALLLFFLPHKTLAVFKIGHVKSTGDGTPWEAKMLRLGFLFQVFLPKTSHNVTLIILIYIVVGNIW